MHQYIQLVQNVLNQGERRNTRTGTDAIACFSENYKVDLSEGFPLLTTKKVNYRSVFLELLWYLRGEDHIRWLRDEKSCHIWDDWADDDGYVGPIYPVLWRNFPAVANYEEFSRHYSRLDTQYLDRSMFREFDQIQYIIDLLENNPKSRRMVLNTWYPGLKEQMALPPCHIMVVFSTIGNKLNCHLTQRSGDIALGIPFNLACYSALTMALSNQVGLEPGTFSHTIVDAHIYDNHIKGLEEQIERQPRDLPRLELPKNKNVDELTIDDFKIRGYRPHPKIKFKVAV